MIQMTETPLSVRMAKSVMQRYTPEQVKWHYEHGLVLQSIYAVGKRYGDNTLCRWVQAMYDTQIGDDGVIKGYVYDTFNLDNINAGKLLFELHRNTGASASKYRSAFETLRRQLSEHPRTNSGGFWHKKGYPHQMWLDGLYMQGPFMAQYAAEYGTDDDFKDIVAQLVLIESHTRDKASGLLYHAWDESRTQAWADKASGRSAHFWGRAMGWYCMTLLDVLDFLPESLAAERETLIALARSMTAPLRAVQDADSGLWYQVLDAGKRGKNYLESSASSMFVYFFLKLLRKGYVCDTDTAVIKEAAVKAYEGLLRLKVTEDPDGNLHLLDTCGGAGLGKIPDSSGPYRDGTFDYYVNERIYTDDFKGIGPFILASLERETSV